MRQDQDVLSDTATNSAHPADSLGRIISLVVLTWVALNWGWTCWFQFTNDDFQWLAGADLSGRGDWLRQAVAPHFWTLAFFRPLVQLSFVLNYLVSGVQPFSYHLVNVVLHAVNAVFVSKLARAVGASAPVALLAAVLFAANPNMTWAVAWVSGRTELICAFFYLAAILFHLQGRLSGALLLFALALCAKESAVSLPFVVLAADWLGLAGGRRARWDAAAYFSVLGMYLLVRALVVGEFAHEFIGVSASNPLDFGNVKGLLRSKITLLGGYLLEPFPLHGFMRSAAVLILGPTAAFAYARRCAPRVGNLIRFAVIWIGATLLPYLGWPRLSTWYLYLALVGTALLFAALTARLVSRIPRGRYRTVAVGVGLAAWIGTSVLRVQTTNEYERRAGELSMQIVRAVVAAVPSPAPHTAFVVTGLEYLRSGFHSEVNHLGVLVYGLPEALPLWFHDRSLVVTFDPNVAWAFGTRPVVYVHWDSRTRTARRIPAASELDHNE